MFLRMALLPKQWALYTPQINIYFKGNLFGFFVNVNKKLLYIDSYKNILYILFIEKRLAMYFKAAKSIGS